ncbi:MAG: Na(+)-translocating NADH-quinone reductase subunit A [Bacteroidales bacterium]|nr:Na(+)-translocating NADH-quinone reductase subunit A [Bacteroidales bacterium]
MKKGFTRLHLITSFLFLYQLAQAQSPSGSGSSNFTMLLLAIVILIAFFIIIRVSDNLVRIQAGKSGDDASLTPLPGVRDLFKKSVPTYVKGKYVALNKGHNILLEGSAKGPVVAGNAKTFAIQPPNFRGVSAIPKVEVEVGDTVKAGDHLLFDKKNPAIKYVSPVSGEVIAVNRGERRSIASVVVLADKEQQYRKLDAPNPDTCSREELVNFLLDSGGWALLRHRPFDVVANTNDLPDNIFISTFDTAPLAPDLNVVMEGRGAAFQRGLEVLGKLTKGKVWLGLDANGENPPSSIFTEAKGVAKCWFSGKHPAGNVGVQIHHIAPITTKTTAWTLGVQDVATLGALFTEGRFNAERVVALTGAELKQPKYVRTIIGANIGELLDGNFANDHVRIISGDVLSGSKTSSESYLNYHDDQVTVVEEGDQLEMFGWLLPDLSTPSASKALPGHHFPDTVYKANTNMHGEKRAFVVTGQYEELLPMDIYPQHLMKAILTNDYEKIEGLGIHELIEEDVALCEFACTSKQPLQQILREGLDMVHEQG